MSAWEGVGTITAHIFVDVYGERTRRLTFNNILFDEVTSAKGETIFEDTEGNLFHVPNVAYYTVEPHLA